MIETTVTASSKFILSLTDPDFTAYKVNQSKPTTLTLINHKIRKIILFLTSLSQIDDPFKKLGPLAIFSAKRHWTVPRSVCLKRASNLSNIESDNVVNSLIRPSDYSSESGSSNSSVASNTSDGLTLRNLNRRNVEFADEYGFKLRGDSPVIISLVLPNSLADVST